METRIFAAAAALALSATTALADAPRQIQIGNDIFVADLSELCDAGGSTIAGYRISVFASGELWIGPHFGNSNASFKGVCPVRLPFVRSIGGGNVTLQQSQDASGAMNPGETQEQDEDDGLDDSGNNTGIAAISG